MIVKFFNWGSPENVTSSISNIKAGDKVVVQHKWGVLIGEVINEEEVNSSEISGQVIRKAVAQDLETALKNRQKESELKIFFKKTVRHAGLGMKIVEIKLSLDGGCVVAVFTADSRIDFRDLVKKISAEIGKTVRFQQMGPRDEAKKLGGLGICGRELCCCKFARSLKSISTDMARCQMIAHRGSERLSGLCGRLMCCLAYECKQYEELSKNLPEKGTNVVYEGHKVKVVDVLILEEEIKILLPDGNRKVVKLDEIKLEK